LKTKRASLTPDQIELKIKQLGLPNKFELGDETNTSHYQLALLTKSVCTKQPILKALQNSMEAFLNVDVQFNFKEMTKYCNKETTFISLEYSGKIYKHQWKMNFIERKPELRKVLDNPYPWQSFFTDQILLKVGYDPIGNSGKSLFARTYVSQEPTNGILIKIDNLDQMELSLIQKIKNYRDRYNKDPKIIFFDFPRAVDIKKVMSATALMEDAKSGHLETSFCGKYKELQIGNIRVIVLSNNAPDLSVLSVDRWRIWRLGGKKYNHVSAY